jgi:hypothetical protein
MMIPSKAKRMASKPVIDLLIHTIRPRGMPEYLKLFEELALPVARRRLGEPLGYYVTQIGPLNQVVHLWAFKSLADLEQRYAAVAGDPELPIISQRRRVWWSPRRTEYAADRIQNRS